MRRPIGSTLSPGRRRRLAAAAAIALAVGCRGDDRVTGRDSAFVATMIELRGLPAGGADSAARAAVLRRHGFTVPSLEAAATALARDPERAAAIWQRIENPPARPAPTARPAPAARPDSRPR